jgi:hypothetical protein
MGQILHLKRSTKKARSFKEPDPTDTLRSTTPHSSKIPIAKYDNNQHAENENIRLQNLWDGIENYASLMAMQTN